MNVATIAGLLRERAQLRTPRLDLDVSRTRGPSVVPPRVADEAANVGDARDLVHVGAHFTDRHALSYPDGLQGDWP